MSEELAERNSDEYAHNPLLIESRTCRRSEEIRDPIFNSCGEKKMPSKDNLSLESEERDGNFVGDLGEEKSIPEKEKEIGKEEMEGKGTGEDEEGEGIDKDLDSENQVGDFEEAYKEKEVEKVEMKEGGDDEEESKRTGRNERKGTNILVSESDGVESFKNKEIEKEEMEGEEESEEIPLVRRILSLSVSTPHTVFVRNSEIIVLGEYAVMNSIDPNADHEYDYHNAIKKYLEGLDDIAKCKDSEDFNKKNISLVTFVFCVGGGKYNIYIFGEEGSRLDSCWKQFLRRYSEGEEIGNTKISVKIFCSDRKLSCGTTVEEKIQRGTRGFNTDRFVFDIVEVAEKKTPTKTPNPSVEISLQTPKRVVRTNRTFPRKESLGKEEEEGGGWFGKVKFLWNSIGFGGSSSPKQKKKNWLEKEREKTKIKKGVLIDLCCIDVVLRDGKIIFILEGKEPLIEHPRHVKKFSKLFNYKEEDKFREFEILLFKCEKDVQTWTRIVWKVEKKRAKNIHANYYLKIKDVEDALKKKFGELQHFRYCLGIGEGIVRVHLKNRVNSGPHVLRVRQKDGKKEMEFDSLKVLGAVIEDRIMFGGDCSYLSYFFRVVSTERSLEIQQGKYDDDTFREKVNFVLTGVYRKK